MVFRSRSRAPLLPRYGFPALVKKRIGLLGGSFNPAHEGHIHISYEAKKQLGLDEIWWVVSPQNPLKPKKGMAAFATRVGYAQDLVKKIPFIRVMNFEAHLHSRYTVDTLKILKTRYPRCQFVWLMGVENMREIPKWRRWTRIFDSVPVAIFHRLVYNKRVMLGMAAFRLKPFRSSLRNFARRLVASDLSLPLWTLVPCRFHPESATSIRARHQGWDKDWERRNAAGKK